MNYNTHKSDPLNEALKDPDELLLRYYEKKRQEKIMDGNSTFYDDTGDVIAKVLNNPLIYGRRLQRYIFLKNIIEENFIIKILKNLSK